jgi:hypothetical protein
MLKVAKLETKNHSMKVGALDCTQGSTKEDRDQQASEEVQTFRIIE